MFPPDLPPSRVHTCASFPNCHYNCSVAPTHMPPHPSSSSRLCSRSSLSHSPNMPSHSIVRGFVPGGPPSSYRSQTRLAPEPEPELSTSTRNNPPGQQPGDGKKPTMFTLGSSSGEDDGSLDRHMKSFQSNLSESIRAAKMRPQADIPEDRPVFSEDEDDSGSAIEDEDDSSGAWHCPLIEIL
ncbi:hypothetical protein K470DRAFT_121535 [Piedraia hortae CBS 480.64]|uniref:DUF3295 domain-containing protein n=1 Tax=Piedraia hortae CBS 480.64 TaxID=1314780 RepID=A0A6A7BTZ8_9PEZI|nr:hypothetical protein K470DRAFT_121535 [Piedraia hortae CBS 480.64]